MHRLSSTLHPAAQSSILHLAILASILVDLLFVPPLVEPLQLAFILFLQEIFHPL